MIKFNVKYEDRVIYPIEVGKLFQDLCNQVGLEAGNIDFVNSDYLILGNPFTNNEDCRTVLSNIAQLAGGFAKIGRDNKVYIVTLKILTDLLQVKDVHSLPVVELNKLMVKKLSSGKSNAEEIIDGNNYFTDFAKNNKWGEVNSLVIGLSTIEGENTSIEDTESIQKNGLTEIKIEDNYFLISQTERKKVINPLWNALKGINYLPFKTTYYGYPYLDTGDLIYVLDNEDNGHISYVFNHTFKFNGTFSGNLETPALTKTQTSYKNNIDVKTKFKQAERKIDKINGIIEDVVEEIGDRSQKKTTVTQDIDTISQKITDIEDLTNIVTGTKIITINDAYPAGNILELHIYGNNTVFDYLYPNDNLQPDDTLYPYGDSKIRFYNNKEDRTIELSIDEVLRANEDVRDEIYVDYQGKVYLIRRINSDGTTKQTPAITELGTLYFTLIEGDNTFEIVNYNALIEVKYVTKSTYTEIFATKVEMNSEITQTAEEINLKVSKKVGENEIISKINQSAEQITIDAEKININGTISANGNFQIDRYGNLKAKSADLSGDFTLKTNNDKVVLKISGTALRIYDWDGTEELLGTLSASSFVTSSEKASGIHLYCEHNNFLTLGVENGDVANIIQISKEAIDGTPYIRNTANGTLFSGLSGGGITVQNGLITNWNINGTWSGTYYVDVGSTRYKISVVHGLMTGIEQV